MSRSMTEMMAHVQAAARRDVIAASEALSRGEAQAFQAVVARVARLEPVALIANAVNSSSAALGEFTATVAGALPSDALKFLGGSVLMGMSATALADVEAVAAAFGVAMITVEVVAVALLLVGVFIAFPKLAGMAMDKIRGVVDGV